MPSADLLAEAERQMVICNACRYCLSYCAVFPAIERQEAFHAETLLYLANLCFDCRDCYHACPYAPPHAFAVNVPRVFAELRTATYREYARVPFLGRRARERRAPGGLAATVGVLVALSLVLALRGPSVLAAPHRGAGAFYAVVPLGVMIAVASALCLAALGVLLAGARRFWRDTRGAIGAPVSLPVLWQATREALGVEYLKGGGTGCAYPGERPGSARRWLHQLVVYGFLLDLASTTVAAFYTHVLDRQAPYPLASLPVALGVVGGLMLLAGTGGLLWLKRASDRQLEDPRMRAMDVSFLTLLLLTSLTGLLLLAFRDTRAMAGLLAIHLGVVGALLATLPSGKLAHAIFRFAALVRHAAEGRPRGSGARPG